MTSMSTTIVAMNRSFPTVMNVGQQYVWVFELLYDALLVEARINIIVNDVVRSRDLRKQSSSSYYRSVRLGRLVIKMASDATVEVNQ